MEHKDLPKHDFKINFNDSPETFLIKNARIMESGSYTKFILFDENNDFEGVEMYPTKTIKRIKHK